MFRLHHIDIWITCIDESIQFYSCLGFNKIKEVNDEANNKKIIIMKKDNFILEMKYHYNNNCNHNNVKCRDNKIFGLAVNNIKDAKRIIEENNLTNKKITVKDGILGQRYFIIADPNGIAIEFIEEN